jgi:hypothetical protein
MIMITLWLRVIYVFFGQHFYFVRSIFKVSNSPISSSFSGTITLKKYPGNSIEFFLIEKCLVSSLNQDSCISVFSNL